MVFVLLKTYEKVYVFVSAKTIKATTIYWTDNPPLFTVATRLAILSSRHLVKAQSYVHSVASTSRYIAISSVCCKQTDLPCARDLVNLTTVTKLVQPFQHREVNERLFVADGESRATLG